MIMMAENFRFLGFFEFYITFRKDIVSYMHSLNNLLDISEHIKKKEKNLSSSSYLI